MTTISAALRELSWLADFQSKLTFLQVTHFCQDSDFHMTFLQKNDGQYRVRPVPKIHGPSWPVPNFALSWPRNPPCFHWKFPWDFWSNVDYQYILLLPEFFLQCTMEICWGFLSGFLENIWKINTEAKAKVSAQRRGPRPCERPRASSWGWSVVHPSLPVCWDLGPFVPHVELWSLAAVKFDKMSIILSKKNTSVHHWKLKGQILPWVFMWNLHHLSFTTKHTDKFQDQKIPILSGDHAITISVKPRWWKQPWDSPIYH